MKINTQDLTGVALDWAVAKSAGYLRKTGGHHMVLLPGTSTRMPFPKSFSPSTRWGQGGPIIERMIVSIDKEDGGKRWAAYAWRSDRDLQKAIGPTPLIAAMRCYIASQLGDEVDVPDELAKQ